MTGIPMGSTLAWLSLLRRHISTHPLARESVSRLEDDLKINQLLQTKIPLYMASKVGDLSELEEFLKG